MMTLLLSFRHVSCVHDSTGGEGGPAGACPLHPITCTGNALTHMLHMQGQRPQIGQWLDRFGEAYSKGVLGATLLALVGLPLLGVPLLWQVLDGTAVPLARACAACTHAAAGCGWQLRA